MSCGRLVLSLDFELFWGVHDSRCIDSYGANVIGVEEAIAQMLSLFTEYSIHTTWASVGFLFAADAELLSSFLPPEQQRPTYDNSDCNSYRCLEWIEKDEALVKYFFAADLIRKIAATAHQEVASHTLSHYFCSERGQTVEQFKADMLAAKKIAAELFGLDLKTMVFPRNQCVPEYVGVLEELGFTAYRGLEDDWIHNRMNSSVFMRLFRLVDSYIPLTGMGGYMPEQHADGLINLKGSRFLRPYSKKLFMFEWLKMRRIKGQMLHAAKNGLVFHLWWHPHNFGVRQEYHLAFLREILEYYKLLSKKYGMRSLNMLEAAELHKSQISG